jgi:[protein-PII] uridylyltransferase
VVLVHHKRRDVTELAEQLWYPVWDRGLKLGHMVATVDQAIESAMLDLDRATSLLDLRLIDGDPVLHDELRIATTKLWSKKSGEFLAALAASVDERHRRFGDVAFTLAPDLKNGRGGLRDLHAMRWAERAEPGFASDVIDDLDEESELLIDARVELHRWSDRANETLTLDDQDAVAAALGHGDGQALMLQIALAARRVAWHSDEVWDRWQRNKTRPRRGRPRVLLSEQFELRDDLIELRDEVHPESDPLMVLRAAEMAARTGTTIGRSTLEILRDRVGPIPEPWPEEARSLFAGIFLAGTTAIDVVEDLDQFELMVRLLPEWETVRCRPQRNVLHTFTVDRHLCEAAVNASRLADDVVRPDLLVVGALLHDIGKGYPGDHTEVGMEKIAEIADRMGYPSSDTAVLVDLCRYHLLLSDVAVRRDISDPGTIRAVAASAKSVEFLRLLAALTEADSIATGPATWNSWKAGLVRELVDRSVHLLSGGDVDEVTPDFPPPELKTLMDAGEVLISGKGSTLTVVAPDQPGLFNRVAAVLAMSGLEVLEAAAYSSGGMACSRFVVSDSLGHDVEWDRIAGLAEKALAGRLALSARVVERAEHSRRYRRRLSAEPARRIVHFDNSISEVATVVDVHAPDTVGLLFRLTQAIAEFRLDILSATVQTLGPEAVDSFYLCDRDGNKLTDPELLREVELALWEAMEEHDR